MHSVRKAQGNVGFYANTFLHLSVNKYLKLLTNS